MSVEKFGSSFLYKGNLGGGGEFREGDYSGGDKNQMLFRHNSVLCKENGCGVLAAGEALGSLLYTLLGKQKSRNSFYQSSCLSVHRQGYGDMDCETYPATLPY